MAIPCSVLVLASLLFVADALGGLRIAYVPEAIVAHYGGAVNVKSVTTTTTTLPYPDAYRFKCPQPTSRCADMSKRAFTVYEMSMTERTNGAPSTWNTPLATCPTCDFRCTAMTQCASQLAACDAAQFAASGSNSPWAAQDCQIQRCLNNCPCSSSDISQQNDYMVGSPKRCHANCLLSYGSQIFTSPVGALAHDKNKCHTTKCIENGKYDRDCCAEQKNAKCATSYTYSRGKVCWKGSWGRADNHKICCKQPVAPYSKVEEDKLIARAELRKQQAVAVTAAEKAVAKCLAVKLKVNGIMFTLDSLPADMQPR